MVGQGEGVSAGSCMHTYNSYKTELWCGLSGAKTCQHSHIVSQELSLTCSPAESMIKYSLELIPVINCYIRVSPTERPINKPFTSLSVSNSPLLALCSLLYLLQVTA